MTFGTKRTTRVLRNESPRDRFRTCPVPGTSEPRTEVDGKLLIYRGLEQSSSIAAAECFFLSEKHQKSSLRLPGAQVAQSMITTDQRPLKLDSVDQYTKIAGALTLLQRVDLLWSTCDNVKITTPEEVLNFVVLSTQQILDAEIHSFLSHSSRPNSVRLDRDNTCSLSQHLSGIAAILEHPYAKNSEISSPPEIIRLIFSTLASCRPKKKRQIAKAFVVPSAIAAASSNGPSNLFTVPSSPAKVSGKTICASSARKWARFI